MKYPPFSKQLIIVLFALSLAQFACSFGAPTPSENPQQSPANGAQATQPSSATKSPRGTPDEAKAMLTLAVEHYNSVGRDQALKDFNNGVPPFKDRDLYVACTGPNHVTLANGGFPTLVGQSVDSVITTTGQPLGKATWDAASSTTVNSVNYHWTNPVSGQTEPKTLFFLKFDANVVCGVGAYNP